ncbi:MAG: BatA and WFA domain-containing protein [Chthoniobacteraceae bacterium]
MTFLAPWAVWFAAGIPIIVMLYLLKLKRRPLPVSTLMFWQRVLEESRRRAFFQKLRNLFSLLLHLLIFALILGALARPVLDRAVRDGSSTVLIVDLRARMQARESGGDTRLEIAKRLAANYLGQAAAGRPVAIIGTHHAPAVVTPFTTDEKELREGLASLAPTDATGDLEPAIALAEQLLAAREGNRRIVVFSAGKSPIANRQSAIEWVSVGAAHDNVAITRFATRPLLSSPQTSEVLLSVANYGTAPATANLELALDGKLLDVKPLTLAPGETSVQVFPTVPRNTANSRGWLAARLDTDDALPADNVAYAVLPPQQTRRVLLVTKGNWFLEKMLAADQSLTFELLAPDSFQLALAEKFDAVILDNTLPADFDLARTAGNFLFIKKTPFASVDVPLDQPLISETNVNHPALRLVNLQNVTVVRATTLTEPPRGGDWRFETPIRSFDHPLMITGERRNQRLAALAMDLTESDLPLRVAFPLLMSNTLQWLAGSTVAHPPTLPAGEIFPLASEQTVWTAPQRKWSGELKPDRTQFAHGVFQPLANGYYLLNERDSGSWLAVNTFSETESDLRLTETSTASPALPRLAAVNLSGWPIWQYLALAALLLFTLEWWLFHRRRTE